MWNGKKPKIALELLQNPKGKAGLRLVDIRCKLISLLSQWTYRCKSILFFNVVSSNPLIPSLGQFIWQCNLLASDVDKLIPNGSFSAEALKAWCEFSYETPKTADAILNQVIWCNSCVRIDNLPIIWDKAMRSNIRHV